MVDIDPTCVKEVVLWDSDPQPQCLSLKDGTEKQLVVDWLRSGRFYTIPLTVRGDTLLPADPLRKTLFDFDSYSSKGDAFRLFDPRVHDGVATFPVEKVLLYRDAEGRTVVRVIVTEGKQSRSYLLAKGGPEGGVFLW